MRRGVQVSSCEIDKVRFIDLDADTHDWFIHSVEVSDERSHCGFVTFYTKTNDATEPRQAALLSALKHPHDPQLFHRDPDKRLWLKQAFPQKSTSDEYKFWHKHHHLVTKRPPQWEDIEPYAGHMHPELRNAVKAHMEGRCERCGVAEGNEGQRGDVLSASSRSHCAVAG